MINIILLRFGNNVCDHILHDFLQISIYDVEVVLAKDKLTVNGREAGLPIVIEKMRVALIGGYIEVTGLDGASRLSSLF